ncbi:MAG: xanthine dehydrogenase molybdenum-binding subunit XdhA [Lachnospiraceae bacterium]|nr:xanthine dehydrogenase molybdenum-binding subunit XdhA [Lachnospiraceae bacterium]
MLIGKSVPRVDAYDKATGRTKYTDDLCSRKAYIAKIVHSTITHGFVKSIDTSEAEKVPGVVKILTCFDAPEVDFPTAGHPYSNDPSHQDIADRHLLNRHVRYYGDEVAVVVAEDEVSAVQAMRKVKVEYEELPFVLDAQKAMEEGAPVLHDRAPNNCIAHTDIRKGNVEEAIKEPGLICVDGWYETPKVQHCHIENFLCYAYMENGRIVVVASTQIPHIVRRIIGQALSMDWGKIRVIKPYIGGGFGDKQDALYEPLCAWLTTQVGGHCVKLECTREETFTNCRVRHGIRTHIKSYLRPDGTPVARKFECWSNQGAYGSHGHGIAAKGMGVITQLYPCDNVEADAYTVYTNTGVAGAMRGYGIPQAMFAQECHCEDICRKLGLDPLEYRRKFSMPVGFYEPFSKNEQYFDTYNQCLDRAIEVTDYKNKVEAYKNQTGDIRRGIGIALSWYNTATYPISPETSSCRMVMNQDGSVQVQVGETEIGQGADTAYTQMAAETLGFPLHMVNVVSNQDTDVCPFGTGAYASRQTYTAGMGIRTAAEAFKKKILERAFKFTKIQPYLMDIEDGKIVRVTDGRVLMTMQELSLLSLYDKDDSEHLHIETTTSIRSNAYSFGCCIAEVEVDLKMCKCKLVNITNVHDVGTLINPALARAQVHGGMSMGIGFALSEVLLYDEKTGRLLNDNLLDYKLSTFMDHPHLEAQFIENAEPTSAYGTKGLGEPPVNPVAPAIRNAILNATDVACNELPMRPHLLFKRFKEENLI